MADPNEWLSDGPRGEDGGAERVEESLSADLGADQVGVESVAAPSPVSPKPSRLSADAPIALRVRSLSKSYEDTVAVDDLSFDVRAGEILGLVGPNGAGKTTTLRSIVGVLPLQDGLVEVGGFDLNDDEVQAKKCLAWVPDDPQPFDTLTVREHIQFTAQLYGIADWEQEADSLLERFELTQKRNALGGELSRGMRQKLAFSCAWMAHPKVILMDEPLSGLDPRGIRAAKDAIARVAADGAAVILSSHLLELIEELADTLLIIHRGRRVFHGTLDEARALHTAGGNTTLEQIFMAVTDESSKDVDSPEGWPS